LADSKRNCLNSPLSDFEDQEEWLQGVSFEFHHERIATLVTLGRRAAGSANSAFGCQGFDMGDIGISSDFQ
jgi:hypothetical protein